MKKYMKVAEYFKDRKLHQQKIKNNSRVKDALVYLLVYYIFYIHSSILQNYIIYLNSTRTKSLVGPMEMIPEIQIEFNEKYKKIKVEHKNDTCLLKVPSTYVFKQILAMYETRALQNDDMQEIEDFVESDHSHTHFIMFEKELINHMANDKDFTKHFDDNTTTFDMLLKDNYIFNKNIAIKEKILNNAFLQRLNIDKKIDAIDLEEFQETLKESRRRMLDEAIEEANNELEHLTKHYKSMLHKKQEKIEKKIALENSNFKIDRMKRILNDPRIEDFKIDREEGVFVIYTTPLFLDYDQNKIQGSSKLRNLKKGERLAIGKHKITIRLNDMHLEFSPVTGYINVHIERYTCYGTFFEPIAKAKEERNIPRLIALALQMLQYATIGDPAGNTTINNAYTVSENNMVTYNNTAYYHNYFVDNFDKIRRGRDNDEDEDGDETIATTTTTTEEMAF